MTKQQRFQAVREWRVPDYMPLWPRVMFQMIFSYGLLLPVVTGVDWYDAGKLSEVVLACGDHLLPEIASF
jgi:hypothetical protein